MDSRVFTKLGGLGDLGLIGSTVSQAIEHLVDSHARPV
ncbi:MAG: hypothetical protein RLY70_3727 [Planctomycetota bacterium]